MKISLLDMRLFLALAGLCSFLTATASAFLVLQTPATAVRGVTSHQQSPTNLCAFLQQSSREEENDVNRFSQVISQAAVTAAAALVVLSATVMFASPAYADGATKTFKLPPIDYNDQNRCVLKSSSMGQANAARDKLVDLRECKIPDANARGFDLSGVLMTNTDLPKANFQDAYFSKGYMHDSNMDGADFSNGIIDRASFRGSSVKGAIFKNAVLTSTSFEEANVQDADFSEAAMGDFDIKRLCKNPTLKGTNPTTGADTRESVGCS